MKPVKPVVKQSWVNMWWFPVLAAALVILGTPLVLIPQSRQLISGIKDMEKLETDLAKAEKKIGQINSVDQNQVSQLSRTFKQALPDQKPYYQVLLLLQQLGVQTGVRLGDFELDPGLLATDSAKAQKPDKQGYFKLDTELTISGTTDQVADFVTRLHQSVPLLVINSVSISTDDSDKLEEDVRRVSLEMQILYMPEAAAAKTVGLEPLEPLSSSVNEVSRMLAGYFNPEALVPVNLETVSDFSRTDIFNY